MLKRILSQIGELGIDIYEPMIVRECVCVPLFPHSVIQTLVEHNFGFYCDFAISHIQYQITSVRYAIIILIQHIYTSATAR